MIWQTVQSRLWGAGLGALLTIAAVNFYRAGWFDGLVLAVADWHFKHVNRIEAAPEIVMIDINDFALERVHRWPWPRSLHADLVNLLHELGADVVLMDIVFSEPMAPRLEHPALGPDSDVDPPAEVLGEIALEDAVQDDDLLAEAMGKAGNIYPAMFCRLSKPAVSVPRMLAMAVEILAQAPRMSQGEFVHRLNPPSGVDAEGLYQRARVLRILEEDFTLSVEEVAARLETASEAVERYLAEMRRLMARRLVTEHLAAYPQAPFAEVRSRFLPALGPDQDSPDRQELLRAYRACRSLAVIRAGAPDVPSSLVGRIPNGWDLTPPLDKLVSVARCNGLVTFEKDAAGGVLRRVPILVNVDGKLIKQLGFAVACDRLDIDDTSFAWDADDYLTMSDRRREHTWRVPLDENGLAMLNWHVDPERPQWQHSFQHVAVSRIMELALNRQAIRRNETVFALRMDQAVRTRFADQPAGYAEYVRRVRARDDLRRRRTPSREGGTVLEPSERMVPGPWPWPSLGLLHGPAPCRSAGTPLDRATPQPAETPEADVGELDTRIAGIEEATRQWLAFAVKSIENVEPESPEEAQIFALYRTLEQDLVQGRLGAEIERKNAELSRRNEYLLHQLRPLIEDKLCFVGYTAASVADMVNSPVFENMPGVLAHANVANTILQNRFPETAPRWLNGILLISAGFAVTLITGGKGPWVSLVAVGLVLAALLGGGALLFYRQTYILAASVAALTAFVCWAFITLYRQATEERHRRNLARALARSTSPAMAAEILRHAGRLDLSPRPAQVSCYFSDLQGFTTLSERLGPADTQAVLNRYLERMSEVLVPHGAFSKFMGDGIFAFFNAPLLPVERHPVAACEVALKCLRALAELRQEQAAGSHAEVFAELVMRAGVHTGTAYVGEFGSENQTDYTCIGDTVNLAARLEPANKVFGTQIMVSQACRQVVASAFAFRPLGLLQVKGKRRAVAVYELLGRSGEVEPQRLAYAEQFAAAVKLFQQRSFADAQRAFAVCTQAGLPDPAAELYLTEIERHLRAPPGPDWNQAIRLTTK